MPKRALVILAQGFEEIEAITIIDILRRAGIDVTVSGLNAIEIKGSHGITLIADEKLDTIKEDFQACILPGGLAGAKNLASSEKVNLMIKQMHKNGKIIAAICASPAIVLAPAGILKNKTATCYPGMQDSFGKETIFKEAAVVIDGNIITSRGPATALLFALSIVEILCGKEARDKLKRDTLLG